ncbi:unnamed protein product [Peronospora farinosa]|uniref:Uncharacterized protein n=1 Tax=Peronospora farinosa TaxID=134698 RepID=A0AAV0ST67_9STRA|nr:unnamed protein product [Peronospora farinosa]CAI5707255.1 unnamed protein product [Peronospora farinosa]
MARHPRKQPTKLDINDSLAQLSMKKPDAADKCREDLLESIHRTSRILCHFEKHLDTVQRADLRKPIKARLLGHASELLSFESTVSLRISCEITKHKSTVQFSLFWAAGIQNCNRPPTTDRQVSKVIEARTEGCQEKHQDPKTTHN